jgi:hypothetical protein
MYGRCHGIEPSGRIVAGSNDGTDQTSPVPPGADLMPRPSNLDGELLSLPAEETTAKAEELRHYWPNCLIEAAHRRQTSGRSSTAVWTMTSFEAGSMRIYCPIIPVSANCRLVPGSRNTK